MKKTTLLKIALFSFICGLLSALAAYITQIELVFIFPLIAAVICIVSLLAYVCSLIFGKFNHSVNVIVIIIFSSVALIGAYIDPVVISADVFRDFSNMSYITLIWTCSTLAAFVSLMVLIGKLIFKKEVCASDEHEAMYAEDNMVFTSNNTEVFDDNQQNGEQNGN